ncbi:hypothetical protein QE152_g26665 [Popillia japonica]|uniref:Uncharacterized protein n=1 Tax=Popillia japonica TaxID=7064 RepID=A0AAW1JXI4_POPJA
MAGYCEREQEKLTKLWNELLSEDEGPGEYHYGDTNSSDSDCSDSTYKMNPKKSIKGMLVFGTAGATYVRRRNGEQYKPECVVPILKYSEASIMASLEFFNKLFGDKNMNNVCFQQDNAPAVSPVTSDEEMLLR